MLIFFASFILIASGGFSWAFVKKQTTFYFPVEFSIFYRFVFASFFLIISSILRKQTIRINFIQLKKCLFVGLFYYIIYFFAAYNASLYIVSGVVSCISATKIIFVELFLSIFYKRRPSSRIIFIAIMAVIGTILISYVNIKSTNISKETLLLGLLIAFMSPVGNSLSNVYLEISKEKTQVNPTTLAIYGNLIGALFFLVLGIIKYKTIYPLLIDKTYLIGLGYLSIVSSGIATISSYYLISKIGSLKTTFMSLAHPPVSMILAHFFEGYILNFYSITGMFLMLLSVYFGVIYQKNRKNRFLYSAKTIIRRRYRKYVFKYKNKAQQ